MTSRPPSTPRASLGGTALPTPSARRKSALHRPGSSLANPDLSSLRRAIAQNDPAKYVDSPDVGVAVAGNAGSGGRQPVLPGMRTAARPMTPTTPSYARARTPTGFGSRTATRTPSRQSSRADEPPPPPMLLPGTPVSFEVAGEKMEGTLRFVGEVEGKAGTFGGVELDEAFAGRGKNDGSVQGTQYFACPPLCGLFLPLAKITPKPRAAPALTDGSRASKYAAMSAKDLPARRLAASTSGTPTVTKPTPRKSLSPTKPPAKSRTSLSPTKPTTFATPRPTRMARPSLGGATPTTACKSLGGPSATPRAPLASSIKRPPSSLRHTAPDVPPIPAAYGLKRSVTPSSISGRVTPSTPGAMMRRRTSAAQSDLSASHAARPTTPSFRSSSRQSFASSVSRQSHRSMFSASDADDFDDLRTQVEEARQREAEIRQLLEGSEKLGREMEDRLTEKNNRIKQLEERVAQMDQEQERAREAEKARLAGAEGEEGARERDRARILDLETQLADVQKALDARRASYDKLKLEDKHKTAAKEAEVESLRDRLAQANKAHEEERNDLNSQLDKLRSAGQALCETYEEKIAEIELARLEAVDLAETLQAQLDGRPSSDAARADSPSTSRTLSASVSAAQAIDAETARAELEHLRAKFVSLEEQLEDARIQLEQEVADARARRQKHVEAEQVLKGEIKSLKEVVERSSQAESRSAARIQELQAALVESQSTLEAERSELEGLRHDANGDATSALADDLKRVHKELVSTKATLEKTQREATQHADLVAELRQDLRSAEREIDRLQKLSPRPETNRRTSVASSRSSLGGDDAAATREQIVGLKSIIETLTAENKDLAEQNSKVVAEAKQLKDAQQALERTVENLMSQLDNPPSATKEASSLPTSPSSDSSLRRELEQLRSELKEVQRKSELEIKALNQEVNELESLVESKIYHEDELETELQKYKALAAKAGAASTSSSTPRLNGHGSSKANSDAEGGAECEMCGEKGHDLDSCPDFAPASPTKSSFSDRHSASSRNGTNGGGKEWCDDCEEFGHSLENCPLASEIF
ncbi:hypothetical protein NBRC10512_007512 [Rhodotorula toruloides]|uniref:RHTO0S06e00122g1_1 n=2 Tax=Rhodotorula toruloides TaxID=5286 RepID=A0A061AUE8_RHOTO|nr:CAP-Gly domain-containing protein [Rhodotorula toruloides NP11]EMS23997.1 CAP-Gly domain-containing protein [Rhodotorula toruloides NP11]CDR41267.1 RHTO0S06e00122g1_1 [Rhodotorula toruloides]